MYNLGLVGFYHPNFNRWHRPVVCGLVSRRFAVLSATNLLPAVTDPVIVRLPLDEGEVYQLGPSFMRPRINWPYGLTLSFPDVWPPT